jgi:hypothetical protein
MTSALLLILLLLALPAVLVLALATVAYFHTDDYELGQRREAAGQCTKCGYDLRASKDRCPECGKAVTQPA